MTIENLWGVLPEPDCARTPLSICKEQAAQLGQLTKNLLEGNVVLNSAQSPNYVRFHFFIAVPTRDNYSTAILEVTYPILPLYPATGVDFLAKESFRADNETAFIAILQGILQSVQMQKVIAALLRFAQESDR